MNSTSSTSPVVEGTLWHLDVVRERRTQRVRDELLLRHLPLAYSLARQYEGSYGTEEELVKVASRGLVRAVQEFDPACDEPFATFAEPAIVAELEDFVQDAEHPARAHRRSRAQGDGSKAADGAVASAIGRQTHVRDLAGFLGCDVDSLVGGLMLAVEREPHLIPSPAARAQPDPDTLPHRKLG